MSRRSVEHFVACMLGGALGDALGWPVEFLDLGAIRRQYGPQGITEPVRSAGGKFEVTDDTQMSLFTAEGLIRAQVRFAGRGVPDACQVMWRAYRRWYRTQRERFAPEASFDEHDGSLVRTPALWAYRAPGNTCMTALESDSFHGMADNDSKGCGTVMKTAPVGLAAQSAFELAVEIAGITHGHVTGQLAAGALSAIVAGLVQGLDLLPSIESAERTLRSFDGHHEVLAAMQHATRLARRPKITPEVVAELGGGWVAEEALAIALLCALRAESFEHGVRLAVNHSGDSDSTGAIAGNLLGLLLGLTHLPKAWLAHLELRATIEQVARDLFASASGAIPVTAEDEACEHWLTGYPAN